MADEMQDQDVDGMLDRLLEGKRPEEIAGRLNVPAQTLAEAAIRELVSQPESDFEQVASRLLKKNRELYERLR